MTLRDPLPLNPDRPPVSVTADERTSPLTVVNLLLRNFRLITATVVLIAVLAIGFTFVRGANYVAESRFKPQAGSNQLGRLTGLASQFGLSVPTSGNDESVDFYAELAKSNELLRELAKSPYRVEVEKGKFVTGTIVELYRIKGKNDEEKLLRATDLLRQSTSAGAHVKANLVTLRTVLRWPDLAVGVNRRLLDLINEFNVKKRRTSASAEREFVEARLAASRMELRQAEGALQQFREQNRGMLGAPQLATQSARLERQVTLETQVYQGLATAYEQVRLEEVRNTPLVTVVDGPEHSAKRAGGSLKINALIAMMVGLLLGVGVAFVREFLRRVQVEDPATYDEFERLTTRFSRLNPFRRRKKSLRSEPQRIARPSQAV